MLEGDIGEIQLIERLVELWREQFTGAIRFENDGIIKIVYFKGGDILSASTNDRADSIDEILMRAGKVSREHVKQALAKRKENETLGDALLNLGFITRKELTWARRVQVVGVIRSIAAWEAGSFTIVADYLPKRDEGTLFPLPQVLTELIVTDQDRQRVEKVMEGGSVVFERTADFDDVFKRLGLNEDAEAIVGQIDGRRTAAEVAAASGRDTFNAFKLMQALATLGVLRRVGGGEPQFAMEDEIAAAGVADAADMWDEPAPPPPPEPAFTLDEAEAQQQPTLEVPVASSAWDEVDDAPPIPAAAVPIPAPVPSVAPPPIPMQEEWGFDEAQIETARRVHTPPPAKSSPVGAPIPKGKRKAGNRLGLLLTIMAVFLLAAGGYYGFLWWQKRQEPTSTPVVERRPPLRPAATATTATAPPAETMTIVEATDTTTTTTTTTAAPPAKAPIQITAEAPPPNVETTTTAPLPAVTPKAPAPAPVTSPGDRARYDEMARLYAANATGNFTVQIQILCEPSNLTKAIAAGGEKVWFVPQTIGARACYRVFWGRYNTREEAQRALGDVPASLRDRSSSVKPVPKG